MSDIPAILSWLRSSSMLMRTLEISSVLSLPFEMSMLGLPSNIGFRKGIFVTAKEIMTSIETSAPIGITAKTRGCQRRRWAGGKLGEQNGYDEFGDPHLTDLAFSHDAHRADENNIDEYKTDKYRQHMFTSGGRICGGEAGYARTEKFFRFFLKKGLTNAERCGIIISL